MSQWQINGTETDIGVYTDKKHRSEGEPGKKDTQAKAQAARNEMRRGHLHHVARGEVHARGLTDTVVLVCKLHFAETVFVRVSQGHVLGVVEVAKLVPAVVDTLDAGDGAERWGEC